MKRRFNTHQSLKQEYMSFCFVLTSIGVYILAMSYFCILRFESFSANVYDLGIMIQVVWNTSHGWFFQDSVNMGYPMMRFWMAHWEFFYLFVALIYKICSSPYTILIIQTTIVALGALPIYWLAKEKLGDNLISIVFPISYLLYPAIQNANLNDIHGVTFAASFLLFAFYYLQKKKINLFIIFGIIALTCREDSALPLFMMGLYAIFIMKEKKLGIGILAVSFVWFFIWYERMAIRSLLGLPQFVIMEGAETHWDHMGAFKSDPLYMIKFLAKKYNIRYFFYLFGPVIFLSFLSPTTLLIALPMFVINLLSSYYYTHEVKHHYSVTIAPFIYISAIFGLKNLLSFLKIKKESKQRLLFYAAVIIPICSLLFFFMKSNVFDAKKWKITDHHRVIKSVIREIPQNASISAESRLAAHAAERHELYVFNDRVGDADYILYDFYAPTVNLVTRKSFQLPFLWPDNDSIRKVLNNRDYGIVRYEDGICLFQKGADFENGLNKLAIAEDTEITHPLNEKIYSNFYCKGYNTFDMLSYYIQQDKLGPIFWKKAIHFTCFWKSEFDYPDSLGLVFKIQNENQQFYIDDIPVFGLYPLTTWKQGELIRDEVFWEIPDEMKLGLYQVYVKMISSQEENYFIYLFDLNID